MKFLSAHVGMLLFAACGNALGTTLVDPTRPPEAFSQPVEEGIASSKDKPVLQSVIISPGRKVAIISGETVPLGGSFGGSRLVKVTETEVVLRQGNEMQVLRLFPHVEKQSITGKPSDKKVDRRQ
ncbi:MAG TPA: MSHA biogenesis protein MshK [Noviherbaspirillum sp.]|nr:MSHA biogenesis protein MshK [Noviherbaspirillum sp.]